MSKLGIIQHLVIWLGLVGVMASLRIRSRNRRKQVTLALEKHKKCAPPHDQLVQIPKLEHHHHPWWRKGTIISTGQRSTWSGDKRGTKGANFTITFLVINRIRLIKA